MVCVAWEEVGSSLTTDQRDSLVCAIPRRRALRSRPPIGPVLVGYAQITGGLCEPNGSAGPPLGLRDQTVR
jgi:hypothetical protein